MADEQRVRIFSNGDAYRGWLYNNCDRCVKRPTCFLEESIASACILDGTISLDVAARLGMPKDGSEQWWCKERQTSLDVTPPAAHEMVKAGADLRPGFEDRQPVPTAGDGGARGGDS